MLKHVAEGVLVRESEFLQSNAVVVQGRDGVLLIDAGVTGEEMAALAGEIAELGHLVVAGFSTHPHWDHLLWHAGFGEPPRYGTARCAATVRERLPDAAARSRVAGMMPPELAGKVPLDLLGDIVALPDEAVQIPWDGPRVRIIEHQAHAPGHASLFIEDCGVLVAGDMLSDLLIPMLDAGGADPLEDYLGALRRLEAVVGDAMVVVPGHGSVGGAGEVQARIDLDRAYVESLRDGRALTDPRVDVPGMEWLAGVDERQRADVG